MSINFKQNEKTFCERIHNNRKKIEALFGDAQIEVCRKV